METCGPLVGKKTASVPNKNNCKVECGREPKVLVLFGTSCTLFFFFETPSTLGHARMSNPMQRKFFFLCVCSSRGREKEVSPQLALFKIQSHSIWDANANSSPSRKLVTTSFLSVLASAVFSSYPTTNDGMQNGSCTHYIGTRFFLHLWRRFVMLSRCLVTIFLHRSSVGSFSRVRCWLGNGRSRQQRRHFFFFMRRGSGVQIPISPFGIKGEGEKEEDKEKEEEDKDLLFFPFTPFEDVFFSRSRFSSQKK